MRKSSPTPRGLARHFIALVLLLCTLTSPTTAGPVPANKPAHYPDWWFDRDVIPRLNPANTNPAWPEDYPSADDYAAVNLGQLKYIVSKATVEFNAFLPAFDAGASLNGLISTWQSVPQAGVTRDDYSIVNQGQIKVVAKLFYDRLAEIGYTGRPLFADEPFPWTSSDTDDDSYAVANLGQVKHVFSFDVIYYLNSDKDGDGLTNLTELSIGTNLASSDTDADGIWDKVEVDLGLSPTLADADQAPTVIAGLRLRLKAGAGIVADGGGYVDQWQDQSGVGNHAIQSSAGLRPQIINGVLNGQEVVRFDGIDDALQLPDFMSAVSESEVFIVNRLQDLTKQHNALARFGFGYASTYVNDGSFYNDYGTNDTAVHAGPGALFYTRAHVFNSSISSDGVTITRFNGRSYAMLSGLPPVFPADPVLGADAMDGSFNGDIAEVLVYDRVLSAAERSALNAYFAHQYDFPDEVTPSAPILNGHAASSSQIDLAWALAAGTDQHLVATIQRKSGASAYEVIAVLEDAYAHVDTGLTPGTVYTYRVKLDGYTGASGYSEEIALATPLPVASVPTAGLRLWLRPTVGLPHAGSVAVWSDQSGLGHHATQSDPALQPQVISAAWGGFPVVRFNGEQSFHLPDIVAGASAGEIIALLRVGTKTPAQHGDGDNTIWDFGQPTGYHSDQAEDRNYIHRSGFGLEVSQTSDDFPKALVSTYHLHATSSDGALWVERYNGEAYSTVLDEPVVFGSEPTLGLGFVGDFVEILVYDRVLNDSERDAVKNYFSSKYTMVSLDASAPSTPAELGASDIAINAFDFSWSASSDNVGVVGYDLYCNNLKLASVPATTLTYSVTGLAPATVYSMSVSAYDAVGNLSLRSLPLAVSTLADTEAPSVPSALAGSLIAGNKFTLTWSASSDNISVVAYDIYRDGVLVGSSADTLFRVTGLTQNQTYQMSVQARDTSGNSSGHSQSLDVTTNQILSIIVTPIGGPSINGRLALGEDFSIGMRDDGKAVAWGNNSSGQLGRGSAKAPLAFPFTIRTSATAAASGVTSISAGRQHGLMIVKASPAAPGVLWAWGLNGDGQLGNNSTTTQTYAVRIANYNAATGLNNVIAADAGYAHSLAVKEDGTVWAWGKNTSGQLGNETTVSRKIPVRVIPSSSSTSIPAFPNTFKAVSAGYDHSLALRNDGTVWAWGGNSYGQLGTGNNTASSVPVQVSGFPSGVHVTAITAGKYYSGAVLSNGTVRTWGLNDRGQLGNGNAGANSNIPVSALLVSADAIDAGETHMLARTAHGTVWVWGSNYAGELGGLTPTTIQNTPFEIPELRNVALIAAGTGRSAIAFGDGAICIWGNPAGAPAGTAGADLGLAGSGLGAAEPGYRLNPVQLRDTIKASVIYAGGDQAAVVRRNGLSWLLGHNATGQLGNGTTNPLATPTRIAGWSNPAAYAFGADHSLALVGENVYCSGGNAYGQLGDGLNANRTTPYQLTLSGSPASKVAAGWYHSIILRKDGTVWAWGRNDKGQLGNGTLVNSNTPVQVQNLSGVIAIAAGEAHSVALKNDGTIFVWGSNAYLQLGPGIATAEAHRSAPVQVKISTKAAATPLGGIMAIASGANHILALTTAKKIYSWGMGSFGQLGNNGVTEKNAVPILLANTNIVAIAAGKNHSLAIDNSGTVLAWGQNHRGQVGAGTVAAGLIRVPTIVADTAKAKVSAIAAGSNTSYAVLGNGTVLGWGEASRQQLGYDASRFTPIAYRLVVSSADADGDGMLDRWESAVGIDQNLNATNDDGNDGNDDLDGDDLEDIQEHYYDTLPKTADVDQDLLNDFADSMSAVPGNADSYVLSFVSGDNQSVPHGLAAPLPLVISIGEKHSNVPIVVSSGNSSIRFSPANNAVSYGQAQLTVTTDSQGHAKVYVKAADGIGNHPIFITAGIDAFVSGAIISIIRDSDGDGIDDFSDADGATRPLVWKHMKLWLTAGSGITTDASGNVTQWLDQTGNGLTALPVNASVPPKWNQNAHFGRPAVKFDGINDSLVVSGLGSAMPSFSLVWLMKAESTTATNQKIGSGSAGGFTFSASTSGAVSVGTNASTRIVPGSGADQSPTGILATNRWVVCGFVYSGGLGTFYKNGVPVAAKSSMAVPTTWNTLTLGATDASTLHGDLAELMLYNVALRPQEILELTSYFHAKYDFYSDLNYDGRRDDEETAPGAAPTVTITAPTHNTNL